MKVEASQAQEMLRAVSARLVPVLPSGYLREEGGKSNAGTCKEAPVGNSLAARAALGLHWVLLSLHLPSYCMDCSGATETITHHLCQRMFSPQPLKTELNITIPLLQAGKLRHRGSEGRLSSTSQTVNPRCPDFLSPR